MYCYFLKKLFYHFSCFLIFLCVVNHEESFSSIVEVFLVVLRINTHFSLYMILNVVCAENLKSCVAEVLF